MEEFIMHTFAPFLLGLILLMATSLLGAITYMVMEEFIAAIKNKK